MKTPQDKGEQSRPNRPGSSKQTQQGESHFTPASSQQEYQISDRLLRLIDFTPIVVICPNFISLWIWHNVRALRTINVHDAIRARLDPSSIGFTIIIVLLSIFIFSRIWRKLGARRGMNVDGPVRARLDPSVEEETELAEVMKRRIRADSTRVQSIGPAGSSVQNFGCEIIFHPMAVDRLTEIKTSVITNFSDIPEGKKPITPIFECILDGVLTAPVQVEIHSWGRPGMQSLLYRKEDERCGWELVRKVTLSSKSTISFSTRHFTKFGVFVDKVFSFLPHRIRSMLGLTQHTTRNFLYAKRDGTVVFVSSLFDPKLIADVRSSLAECGYIHSLLVPETLVAPDDGKISVRITCCYPESLLIREFENDVKTTKRQCEHSIEISDVSENLHCNKYFPLEIGGENLVGYEGQITLQFSMTNGRSIKHQVPMEWPPPVIENNPNQAHSTEVIAGTYVGPGAHMSVKTIGGEKKVTVNKSD